MKQVKKALLEADGDLRRGQALINNASKMEKKAADLCSHPKGQIRRTWESGNGPPWTICLLCGYAEEGWGVGEWKLPSYIDHMPIPSIGRNELMKKRRFFRTQMDISHEKICVPHHGKPKDRSKCDGSCHE